MNDNDPGFALRLEDVVWNDTPHEAPSGADDGIPYTTHSGTLNVFGRALRVYRLSNGKAVIHADDMHDLLAGLGNSQDNPTAK